MGGKKIVLTCRRCNSTAGGTIDSHLARDEKFRKIGSPGGPTAKIRIGDSPVWAWADVDFGPDPSTIVLSPRNNAGALQRQKDEMTRAGDGTVLHLEFTGGNQGNALVSLLRAAYLGAFAKLGYRYILRTVFDPIRYLIQNPHSSDAYHYYLPMPKDLPPANSIGFVTAPGWLVSLAVQFNSHLILLPVFDDDTAMYERIAMAKQQMGKESVNLTRTPKPFPVGPEHSFDFDEQLAKACILSLRRLRHANESKPTEPDS
jgi:hypothetical protein